MTDEQKSPVNKAFGDEVKVWRTRRKMSRAALAARTREINPDAPLTPTQIERIENNRRDMTISQLAMISIALNVPMERLMLDAVNANGGLDGLVEKFS